MPCTIRKTLKASLDLGSASEMHPEVELATVVQVRSSVARVDFVLVKLSAPRETRVSRDDGAGKTIWQRSIVQLLNYRHSDVFASRLNSNTCWPMENLTLSSRNEEVLRTNLSAARKVSVEINHSRSSRKFDRQKVSMITVCKYRN